MSTFIIWVYLATDTVVVQIHEGPWISQFALTGVDELTREAASVPNVFGTATPSEFALLVAMFALFIQHTIKKRLTFDYSTNEGNFTCFTYWISLMELCYTELN